MGNGCRIIYVTEGRSKGPGGAEGPGLSRGQNPNVTENRFSETQNRIFPSNPGRLCDVSKRESHDP